MADDVSVVFSAQIGQLIDGVAEVKSAIMSIADPIAEVTSSLGTLGAAFAAAFAVDKIEDFFEHYADLATQTQRNAALLGRSTAEMSGLDAMAKASGGSLDGLVSAMERLGASLANADAGSAKARAGLQALGISANEFRSLSPQAQLEDLAEKFSVLKDGIDKDAIAMAVMGRSGAQMIPIFNQGAAGLREFQEMAERAGSAMSKETAAGFDATGRSLLELGKSFEGVGISVASIFKPAFDGIVKVLIDVVQSFNNSIRSGGVMKGVLEGLSAAVKVVASAIAITVGTIEAMWTIGKAAVEALANDFRDLGRIMYSAMTFNLGGIKSAWADMMSSNHQVALNASSEISTVVKNLMAELKTTWGKGADEQIEIEQKKTARLNILNKDVVGAALAAAQEQIKIADALYAQQVEKINSQASLMQITEAQKTQALLAALDERHSAEMSALAEESQIQGLSKTQYQKLLNDQEQMDQKYAADRQKIIDQAAQKEQQTWKSGADQVAGAFNSQLRGLLSGTTSFSQAMKTMSGDLILKLIEDADKWAIEWIASQARTMIMGNATKAADVATTVTTETAKTTAVTTGVAARTSAEATGATTGILAQIGNAFAVITADAAKTFAGIFAFLAPTMGPAAAGPAASGAAAVEASAAGMAVPGLAIGTDMVLSEGLAYLHSGEQVKPASVVGGGYTPGGQGGQNGSLVFAPQVSAIDAAGVQRFFQQYMPQLARGLAQYQNLNPSTA